MKDNRVKFILILVIATLFSGMINAQDLIVTHEKDSLNCQITKVRDGNIYFTFDDRGRVRNTLLPLRDIVYYEYDYFGYSDLYSEEELRAREFSPVRIGLDGGWSYRTAKIGDNVPSSMESYMKELRSGYNLSFDATYYFRKQLGAGVKFNYFGSKNEASNTSMGDMKDNISIYFVGPTFGTRLFNHNKRNGFVFNIGIGYLGYHDKGYVGSQKAIIKGGTAGVAWDAGYDIGLSDHVALGFQLSFITGVLSSYKYLDGGTTRKIELEKDDYENLSTINLSVGLRFNLGQAH